MRAMFGQQQFVHGFGRITLKAVNSTFYHLISVCLMACNAQ